MKVVRNKDRLSSAGKNPPKSRLEPNRLQKSVVQSAREDTGKAKQLYQKDMLDGAQSRQEARRERTKVARKQRKIEVERKRQKLRTEGRPQVKRFEENQSHQEMEKLQASLDRKHQKLQEIQTDRQARAAMDLLDAAIEATSGERNYLGTVHQPQLVVSNTQNNPSLAVVERTKNQIRIQFHTAMLAQANAKSQNILSLLG